MDMKTHTQARNRGVGTAMGQSFLLIARDLGYRASYFNLVSWAGGEMPLLSHHLFNLVS